MSDPKTNTFLTGPLGPIYAKTALPIIFIMGMNGLLTVVDALFLGHFVGPDALAAVTLMFPGYMLLVALATLVSNGMSSLLARQLGAGHMEAARAVFASAHGLAIALGITLMVSFILFGEALTLAAANGNSALAAMGATYLGISMLCSPLLFILAVHSDALRNEGRVTVMAAMNLLVSVANIAFNYVLIAWLDMGVAGSAWGTMLAQALALAIICRYRWRGHAQLGLPRLTRDWVRGWPPILALGAPQSFGFLGISLATAATVAALQMVDAPDYDSIVTAYGIITRVLTFGFLPLLGLSHAMQTITGNNYGADAWDRSNDSLRLGLWLALVYSATMQAVLSLFAAPIGSLFVSTPEVIAHVARIMPILIAGFAIAGPLVIVAAYFQAIGDAQRAALLGLSKPYLFGIPLTLLLPLQYGEPGIWWAGPVSELLLLAVALAVLATRRRTARMRWGLFHPT